MDLMVNPVITGFRQEVDGTIKELKLGEAKEDAYANIIEQAGGAKLDNNKTASINVSTYTEPVEVTPTHGKDGMKKATITLTNITAGSGRTYRSCATFSSTGRGGNDARVFFEGTDYPEPNTTINCLIILVQSWTETSPYITSSDLYLYEGQATFTTGDAGCGETCYILEPEWTTLNRLWSYYTWTE